MKRIVMAVRDRAADTYGSPFFVVAVGQGVRSFSDEVNRAAPDNQLYMHPEDFDLYELGSFDDSSGTFETDVPRMRAIGKDVSIKVKE